MDAVEKLKQDLIAKNIHGLALDIDETLSHTFETWAGEMLGLFGNPEDLDAKGIVAKYRISKNVPYWQSPEAMAWKKDKIYDNEFQKEIRVIQDALAVVPKIHEIIPIVAYITARPETILSGTQHWLRKHNFPQAPILTLPHPAPAVSSDQWKAQALAQLYPHVSGIVDDNTAIIDYLPSDYPGKIFLYKHTNHPRQDIKIIPCPTWRDVHEAVKRELRKMLPNKYL